jgi:uncharacterized C2H2 Zn-finger protein
MTEYPALQALEYQQQLGETVVQCAHCGQVFRGSSQTLTWSEAKAHVDGHQEKTYRYAPDLKPPVGIETGVEQEPTKSPRRRRRGLTPD